MKRRDLIKNMGIVGILGTLGFSDKLFGGEVQKTNELSDDFISFYYKHKGKYPNDKQMLVFEAYKNFIQNKDSMRTHVGVSCLTHSDGLDIMEMCGRWSKKYRGCNHMFFTGGGDKSINYDKFLSYELSRFRPYYDNRVDVLVAYNCFIGGWNNETRLFLFNGF